MTERETRWVRARCRCPRHRRQRVSTVSGSANLDPREAARICRRAIQIRYVRASETNTESRRELERLAAAEARRSRRRKRFWARSSRASLRRCSRVLRRRWKPLRIRSPRGCCGVWVAARLGCGVWRLSGFFWPDIAGSDTCVTASMVMIRGVPQPATAFRRKCQCGRRNPTISQPDSD